MVGLLDIAPSVKVVVVQGTPVTVPGVSVAGVAHLLRHFPEVKKLMVGLDADISVERLVELAPTAVAAVIAAGTGNPGNEKAEAIAGDLPIGDQLDLLEAILEATFAKQGGVGPFVNKLRQLVAVAGGSLDVVTKA